MLRYYRIRSTRATDPTFTIRATNEIQALMEWERHFDNDLPPGVSSVEDLGADYEMELTR